MRTPVAPAGLDRFEGFIAAAAFATGDHVVVGGWRRSPLGTFIDVMWVRPDGERVLLAPRPEVRDYVTGVYEFDRAEVVPIRGGWDGCGIDLTAGPLHVHLLARRRDWRSAVFGLRPRPLRRSPLWLTLEDRLVGPLGNLLIDGADGVRVAGTTPTGRREWYSVDAYQRLDGGALWIEGTSAGPMGRLTPDLGIGLSDFPSEPALVHVVTLITPATRGGTGPGPDATGSSLPVRRPA